MALFGRRQFMFGLSAGTFNLLGPALAAAESDKAAFMRAAIPQLRQRKTIRNCLNLNGRTRCHVHTTSTTLVVPFGDWDYYYTKGLLKWTPNAGQNLPAVQVPEGFITDLASIPQVFWSLLPKTGRYAYAAIIHDYLYWYQPITKEAADNILFTAMEDSDVNTITKYAIYEAVKGWGHGAWNDNIVAKQKGEKRILKEFPNDRLISWEEWRKRPGVFAD